MENKNQLAATGLRRVFASQILMIFAVVLAAVLEIRVVKQGTSLAAVGIAAVVAMVLLVVAFILNIMGLFKARSAHTYLNAAFYMTIFNLLFNLLSVLPGLEAFAMPVGLAQVVLDAAMVFLVCWGAGDLLKAAGDNGTAGLGKVTILLYVICAVIYAVCHWVKLSTSSAVTVSLLVGMLVCQAAGKLLYLIFLGKSSSALAKQ